KVPSIYKYPPSGEEGKAYLLSESRMIEANSVGIEKCFYEDENGQIHYQPSSIPIEEKYLLIRSDITFFEETIKCRAAQINNLIRTINKCLGSELYRGIDGGLESELS